MGRRWTLMVGHFLFCFTSGEMASQWLDMLSSQITRFCLIFQIILNFSCDLVLINQPITSFFDEIVGRSVPNRHNIFCVFSFFGIDSFELDKKKQEPQNSVWDVPVSSIVLSGRPSVDLILFALTSSLVSFHCTINNSIENLVRRWLQTSVSLFEKFTPI
jgi:hypothetical protein